MNNSDVVEIKNPYLLKAFFGFGNEKSDVLKYCQGYLNSDQYSMGRCFIEFCYSKIFNIHRLPGFITDFFARNNYKYYEDFYNISEELLDNACEELLYIYKKTQDYFDSNNIKTIRLKRMLAPFEIKEYLKQCNNEKQYILLPSNIISSYSYDLRFGGYFSEYAIYREVPVDKIVMIDYILKDPYSNHKHFQGEQEVWVIDNSLKGIIKVDKSCFKYF